jgi:hypothetical protein
MLCLQDQEQTCNVVYSVSKHNTDDVSVWQIFLQEAITTVLNLLQAIIHHIITTKSLN